MNIKLNLQKINNIIIDLSKKNNFNFEDITLVAVSKKKTIRQIIEAYNAGQLHFGENYVKEAIEKIEQFKKIIINKKNAKNAVWHFIGKIQSNKAKLIAENFNWAHSVDNLKIAKRLSKYRNQVLGNLNVCIQINLSNEENKNGVNLEKAEELISSVRELDNLIVRGLMVIPEQTDNALKIQERFSQMKKLFNYLNSKGYLLNTLSMGMSNDYKIALKNNANMVRIGRLIFGERN